ncbi:GNAT family N-acetyltransferase [Paenibacillus macerans]|uniref:GNAT family N-acetyltransferase n=1 Tax=Paenibacillus macerans TaxID=44252 RepID=UPI003D311032
MFKPIKTRIDEPRIQELLEYAVIFDPDELAAAIRLYRTDDAYELYGYEVEGEVAGLIGYFADASKVLEIVHLAVHPEERLKGYGRALVLLALTESEPESIVAVTDEEGTDFFRSIGFRITGFRDGITGEERFRCVYRVEENEED